MHAVRRFGTVEGWRDSRDLAPGAAALRALLERLRGRASLAAAFTVGGEHTVWWRLAGVALVPLAATWLEGDVHVEVYAPIAAWVLVSAVWRSPAVVLVDVAIAAALAVLVGGLLTPYLPFIAVAVAVAGLRGGIAAGALAGCLVSLGHVAGLVRADELEAYPPGELLPLVSLLPLLGLAAALAAKVFSPQPSGRAILQEANRLLVGLQRIAGDMPGGLDVSTIVAAAMAEIRALARPRVAVVYTRSEGLLHPSATAALDSSPAPIGLGDVVELVGEEPIRLCPTASVRHLVDGSQVGHPFWSVVPLRARGEVVGLFLVGHLDLVAARRCEDALVTLAADTALALDNARLFDGTSARAADAARRRIARDLHDSVAQSLAHIKMELELLSLTEDEDELDLRDEAIRLARVAGRALEDVRATITGLRAPTSDDGLVPSLQRHIADLGHAGRTRIAFEATGAEVEVVPEVRLEVLRLAQEAISNALRHAEAETLTVTLEVGHDLVHLLVEDDGRGLGRLPRRAPGMGVGLRGMQERAEALGGELTIRDRLGGGTVVDLRCPTVLATSGPAGERLQQRAER